MNGISYGTSNSGKPSSLGLLDERRRDRVVLEADAEAESGQVVVDEPPHELALLVGVCELRSRS